MPGKVRWEEMFPDEIEGAVSRCPIVYLPFGCLERHGPHMALGNDAIKAHGICVRTAERFGGVVWPASYLHMGGSEVELGRRWLAGMGNPKLWGAFLSPDLFYPLYIALLRQMEMLGFRVAVALTGHYGGLEADMRLIADRFMRRSPLKVWALADWEAIDYMGVRGDHAGRTETSQLWHLYPDLVDMGRLPADRHQPPVVAGRDCHEASPELGERIVASQVETIGRRALRLLAEYRDWPGHAVMPSSDVMALWESVKAEDGERLVCRP